MMNPVQYIQSTRHMCEWNKNEVTPIERGREICVLLTWPGYGHKAIASVRRHSVYGRYILSIQSYVAYGSIV